MATYPSLVLGKGSKRMLRDGREEDVSGDGAVRVRKLHADKFDFDLIHPGLDSTDQSTLETFVSTYGTDASIDFVWPEDGVTYTVRFGKGALQRDWKPGSRRDYRVRLVGV